MTAARLRIPSIPTVGVSLALSLEEIGQSLDLPKMHKGLAELEAQAKDLVDGLDANAQATKEVRWEFDQLTSSLNSLGEQISVLHKRVAALEPVVRLNAWELACIAPHFKTPQRLVWEHSGVQGPADLAKQKAPALHKKVEAEGKKLNIAEQERLAIEEIDELIQWIDSGVGDQ